jgi:hypothetical protein
MQESLTLSEVLVHLFLKQKHSGFQYAWCPKCMWNVPLVSTHRCKSHLASGKGAIIRLVF